jgi:hypothetical protein
MFQETPAANPTTRVGQYHPFAEAIREGARQTRPCKGKYNSLDWSETCAIGSAAFVIGTQKSWCVALDVMKRFTVPFSLMEDIARLNDDGVRREDIADWLDTL